MLHVPTLLFALALTCVVLAAMLVIAVGKSSRRGAGAWAASLALQSVSFAMYALRDAVPEMVSILLVNGAAAMSFTSMAAAVRAFDGRGFRRAWHAVAGVLGAVVLGALAPYPQVRLVVNGVACSAAMLAIAHDGRARDGDAGGLGRGLLRAGLFAGATIMAIRAVAGVFDPSAYEGFRGSSALGVASALLADAVTIITSLGFLLMHRERQERDIELLAMTDPLTGAYNRRTLFDLGEKELARARRSGEPLSIAILDLDHFKAINDTHGHLVGDAVLRRFVDVVRGCLRRGDLLTRYGGEEFCVVLPGEPSTSARAVAERIRAAVESSAFAIDDKTVRVTSSAGVAEASPEDSQGLSWLVRRADEALYAAKREGRNRVVVA